ncbi:MAG: VOC family protein [Myxococcota bacterium]|nr:VOC family protein [Myxococcota bacterium]
MHQGIHHIGLATHDMERTLEFYENALGFEAKVCEMIHPETGGAIRHAFLDMGHGQLIAFMEPNDVAGAPADFDAGINRGLGIRGGMIHFAFWCDDEEALGRRRAELEAKGIDVTHVVDHRWCKSIYFRDPNGIQLEYCCYAQELGASHVEQRQGEAWARYRRG